MEPSYPPALPHGDIEEIFPDVFLVTGVMQIGRLFRFGRNMIIVRQGGSLTLVNSVRLDEPGLERLDALGKVEHVMKLGYYHDRDDAFYVDRYQARFGALPGHTHRPGLTADVEMTADTEPPLDSARLFVFETIQKPEALIHLDRGQGMLLCCDALQNWAGPTAEFNLLASLLMRGMGFFKPHNVGPMWIRYMKPRKDDFERLQALPYEHVLGAHGAPVKGGARDKYGATFARMFGIASG